MTKNPFEQPLDPEDLDPKENKSKESTENPDIDKVLEDTKKSAKVDLDNFEKSNDDFIKRQKKQLGIPEHDPKIELEIAAIQENSKLEKQQLESLFSLIALKKIIVLARLKKITHYATTGAAALAFTAHFAQQKYPDYLGKEKEPKNIEWNEPTRKEIQKLSHEYTLIMKEDAFYEETPDSVFENRFTDFVAAYGPDIEIVHPGDNTSIGNAMYQWIFENLYKQPDRVAYYNSTGALFYKKDTLKMKADGTGYDVYNSSFDDFCAEFSHHINKDFSIRRSVAYAENLMSHGFRQQPMYNDPYSAEYQAHQITRNAIAKYLDPDDHNLNVDFADIYNVEQEYYRELVKTRGYEKNEDIEDLTSTLLVKKNFNDIVGDKDIVFQNLKNIRNILDAMDIDNNAKGELFSIMVNYFPLENKDNNYEALPQNAESIGRILEMKKRAPDDGQSPLLKILE